MRLITILSIFLASLNIVLGQQNLSLSGAIALGLENNYEIQIQRNTQQIAEINNTWGNTSIMPSISLSATGRQSWNFNDMDNYSQRTITPDLNLSWVIFDGFSARINKQIYEETERQSQGNTSILVENTIQDIILAYNNCLLQKEITAVYKELASLSEDRYKRAIDSKEIGVGTTYESLQAKTAWLEDKSNYLQQKAMYENALRTLNFTLAAEDNTQWELTDVLEALTPAYNLEDLSEKLLENNKTLKNQYIYQTLLAKETALAKSAYFPALSLNTGINNTDLTQHYRGNTPGLSSNSSDAYIGLTLSWNIFNGGKRKRGVEIAKVNESTAQVQIEQMKHSLNNQLLQLFSNYEVNKTILSLANEQEATAKLNLTLSEEKFKNGSINSFNYRDVQIIYMNSAISKFKAIYNVIQSNTDLLRITGSILKEYE